MARVYSFPDGKLIENEKGPIPEKDEILEFVKNNPELAASKFREMSTQIQLLADCLNQISVYVQKNNNENSRQIVEIINQFFKS